jgi:RimJ/RimL family protein N-acetyltransferase
MFMKAFSTLIRQARRSDAENFVGCWNECLERGHLKYTATQRRSGDDVKRFRERFSEGKKNELHFIAVNRGYAVVGTCGFVARAGGRTRHRGEIGWLVHPDHVGRGLATRLLRAVLKEAKRRGFKRAEAEIAVENVASLRLAKKLGFRMEGRRQAGILLDTGRYMDTRIFGKILR